MADEPRTNPFDAYSPEEVLSYLTAFASLHWHALVEFNRARSASFGRAAVVVPWATVVAGVEALRRGQLAPGASMWNVTLPGYGRDLNSRIETHDAESQIVLVAASELMVMKLRAAQWDARVAGSNTDRVATDQEGCPIAWKFFAELPTVPVELLPDLSQLLRMLAVEHWPAIARAAWEGFRLGGRGFLLIDAGGRTLYQPVVPPDDPLADHVRSYDPQTEVVLAFIDQNSAPDWTQASSLKVLASRRATGEPLPGDSGRPAN